MAVPETMLRIFINCDGITIVVQLPTSATTERKKSVDNTHPVPNTHISSLFISPAAIRDVKIPDQNIIVSGLDAARQKAAINIFSDNRGNRFTVSVADNILFTPKKITTAPLIIPIAFFNF